MDICQGPKERGVDQNEAGPDRQTPSAPSWATRPCPAPPGPGIRRHSYPPGPAAEPKPTHTGGGHQPRGPPSPPLPLPLQAGAPRGRKPGGWTGCGRRGEACHVSSSVKVRVCRTALSMRLGLK